MDVSDPESWDHLLADVIADFGGIDFAHLNAGIVTLPYPYEISDVTADVYRRLMGVNLDGIVLASTKLVQVGMGSGAGGAIVATASLGGLHPWPEDPYYRRVEAGRGRLCPERRPEIRRAGRPDTCPCVRAWCRPTSSAVSSRARLTTWGCPSWTRPT